MRYLIFLLLSFLSVHVSGNEGGYTLTTAESSIILTNERLLVYEDTSNAFIKPPAGVAYNKQPGVYLSNPRPYATYWAKVELSDASDSHRHWFFVSHNTSIDSLDLFVADGDSILFTKHYRLKENTLASRDVIHKSATYTFPLPKDKPVNLYIRLKNKNTGQYSFGLYEHASFINTQIYDYFSLGLFYGSLSLIALYHFLFFFNLRERFYLFYAWYIIMQALYMSFRDAAAYVFIFPNHPGWIEPGYNLVLFLLSLSVLLYARYFLALKNYRIFNITIAVYSIIRVLLLFLIANYTIYTMAYDMLALCIAGAFSVVSLAQRQKTAYLFCISIGIALAGYGINFLWHAGVITATASSFYSLYYTIIFEALLLAFANAYRLRKLQQEAQQRLFLEQELQMNLLKISTQNQIIQEKTDDMDTFLYRASHDLKGPLRSIDGLCSLGQKEPEQAPVYFRLISNTSKRLQGILNTILQLTKQNRQAIHIERVKLRELVEHCLEEHRQELLEEPGIHFTLDIPADTAVDTEKYSLYSVLQNIIENAIKYIDTAKSRPEIRISYHKDQSMHRIEFWDNGIGVPRDTLENLFQMFYRANDTNKSGVGLGLFIVKQTLDRLHGKITFESEERVYTKVTVELPLAYLNSL